MPEFADWWPVGSAAVLLGVLARLTWRAWTNAPTAWVLEQLAKYERQASLDDGYIDDLREILHRHGLDAPDRPRVDKPSPRG